MSVSGDILPIPDTLANWPWPRYFNPLYENVKRDSDAWLHSFKPFTHTSQNAFDKCNFYAAGTRTIIDIIIDALHHPRKPRRDGEVILGEMTRQFWERFIGAASLVAQNYFLQEFEDYLNSVIEQAADRDDNIVRNVDDYLKTRRKNIGARPSFVIAVLALNIPDEAYLHPAVVEISNLTTDLLVIDNDIVSYNREQSTGDDRHNILTITMHQFNIGLASAIRWAVEYHSETQARMLRRIKELPSFGPAVDEELGQYIRGMLIWPRSSACWSFESRRYFGGGGLEVLKARQVKLLPKKVHNLNLRKENVVVSLIE
ncbi:terpenoid synthase [Wolfiporia cocos MD-104 SS10]|uniref:Terpene synthase n=1 Tax=Wolfiporia cocos (strain MD-104) TaxID=742152 RepID=A0A2H3JR23_WOLCO|nr:terpenoid synthase [Wolfiporia cocos MD-104 SS10]